MRFKTFRTLFIGGLALAGLGGVLGAATCCKKAQESALEKQDEPAAKGPGKTKKKPSETPTAESPESPESPEPAGDSGELRAMDQKVLDLLAKETSSDKLKDAFPGKSYKANLYRDGGGTKFNRVKLDLDRDDKWDEKWSVDTEDGKEIIKRQVAPADDEQYTRDYRLIGGKWVLKKSEK